MGEAGSTHKLPAILLNPDCGFDYKIESHQITAIRMPEGFTHEQLLVLDLDQ